MMWGGSGVGMKVESALTAILLAARRGRSISMMSAWARPSLAYLCVFPAGGR